MLWRSAWAKATERKLTCMRVLRAIAGGRLADAGRARGSGDSTTAAHRIVHAKTAPTQIQSGGFPTRYSRAKEIDVSAFQLRRDLLLHARIFFDSARRFEWVQ